MGLQSLKTGRAHQARIPTSLATKVGQTPATVPAVGPQEKLSAAYFPDTSGIHLAKHILCLCSRSLSLWPQPPLPRGPTGVLSLRIESGLEWRAVSSGAPCVKQATSFTTGSYESGAPATRPVCVLQSY